MPNTHEPVFQLRSDIIRNALIQQLEKCEKELRDGKSAVETALAMDQDLVPPTQGLDETNKKFKDALRHANLHLPKAGKPKARAKAAPGIAWFDSYELLLDPQYLLFIHIYQPFSCLDI